MARRLKIQSDGSPRGTRVLLVDPANPDADPELLKSVTAVEWKVAAGDDKAIAIVTVEGVEVDVEGDEPHVELVDLRPEDPAAE